MPVTGSSGQVRTRVFALAASEGFTRVAIAQALANADVRRTAQERLAEGHLADMAWMTDAWIARASDPGQFLPGAKSVVVLALAYPKPTADEEPPGGPHPTGRIAAYARGRDYHRVFEKKLRRMARAMREELGGTARATVDYGPLLERPLGAAAGMGWQGKSTMLLVPGLGPWVMLGAIATDLDLEPGEPLRKSCGSCTRCVTACPTGALGSEGSVLDSRLCISYHTIENRGSIPRALRAKFGAWIFGCDECLTSCPVGQGSGEMAPGDLAPRPGDDVAPVLVELLTLDQETFAARYQGRAIMRAKRDGLVRNACVALGNTGMEADFPALCSALDDDSPLVRGHAAWAIGEMTMRLPPLGPAGVETLKRRAAVEPDASVQEEIVAALARLSARERE